MAMIPGLLSVVSGAALLKKLKSGNGSRQELEDVKQQLQVVASALEAEKEYTGTVTSKCELLEEINQHLEEQASGLQEEVQCASAEKEQLQALYDQLSQGCTALQRNADVLNVKNKELETLLITHQNTLLLQAKELSDRNAKSAAEMRALEDRLAAEQRERVAERQKLMGTVEQLEREKEQQRLQHAEERQHAEAAMEALKGRVAGLLGAFFKDELSEVEVAGKLADLGLEVQLVEGRGGAASDAGVEAPALAITSSTSTPSAHSPDLIIEPDWTFQPKLVLDCPERMQRLVEACMRSSSSSSRPSLLQPLSSNLSINRRLSQDVPIPKAAGRLTDDSAAPQVPTPSAPSDPPPKPCALAPSITIGHAGHTGPQLTSNPQPQAAKPPSALKNLFRSLSMKERSPPSGSLAAALLPDVLMHRSIDADSPFPPTTDLARAT